MHAWTNNAVLLATSWLRPDGEYELSVNEEDSVRGVKFEKEPKWDKNGVSFK